MLTSFQDRIKVESVTMQCVMFNSFEFWIIKITRSVPKFKENTESYDRRYV